MFQFLYKTCFVLHYKRRFSLLVPQLLLVTLLRLLQVKEHHFNVLVTQTKLVTIFFHEEKQVLF